MNWFKKSQDNSYIKPEEAYAKMLGLDPNDLWSIGRGENGEAFQTGIGTVIKITQSEKEAEIAKELKEFSNLSFVNIFDVSQLSPLGIYGIHQELLYEDPTIDDKFYQYLNILDEQGIPLPYASVLDEDELSEEGKEFIINNSKFVEEIDEVIRSFNKIGIEKMDIQPDNLGRDNGGELKAFDIDEIRR